MRFAVRLRPLNHRQINAHFTEYEIEPAAALGREPSHSPIVPGKDQAKFGCFGVRRYLSRSAKQSPAQSLSSPVLLDYESGLDVVIGEGTVDLGDATNSAIDECTGDADSVRHSMLAVPREEIVTRSVPKSTVPTSRVQA
jgi:hypothetical protein